MLFTLSAKKLFHSQTSNILFVLLVLCLKSLPVFGNNYNLRPNIDQMETTNEDIPWRQIKFITPQQTLSQSQWHSGIPVFSGKGMDHLYLITQYIIDYLQIPGLPDEIIKEEVLDEPIPILDSNKGRVGLCISYVSKTILNSVVFLFISW